MPAIRYVVMIGVVIAAIGCAGLSVDADYDPTVDFTKLKTYDWSATKTDPSIDEFVEKRVRSAVDSQLQAKGYVLSSENPDFLVSMALATRTTTAGSVGVGASVGIPIGMGSVSVGGGKSAPRVKKEGTLVLDFVDPASRSAIWKGTAEAAIRDSVPPEEQQKRINRVVSEVLAQFPPKK